MAADPIIYCLEHITDYEQFERLCHDLMSSEGFSNIEPLGGTKDKGRDAIHISRSNPNDVTIFAYSVRADWRKKLSEDAGKIRQHGHLCNRLVFLNTAYFTPSERDEAVYFIHEEFGWHLELYGLERLRVLLATKHGGIIAKHPEIFTPPFFPISGGISLVFSPDCIVIDHKDCDEALATWLTRRLTLEGYSTWCRNTAPIAGMSVNQTIEALLKQRAFRFISILSPSAVADPDITTRRGLCLAISTERRSELLIPVVATPFNEGLLDVGTRRLTPIYFHQSWQTGLDKLLQSLETANCPRTSGGARVALRSFMPPDVLSINPETLLSNRFPVLKIPGVIRRFTSEEKLTPDARPSFNLKWSFHQVDPKHFLSFHQPPQDLRKQIKIKPAGGSSWPDLSEIDGIFTRTIVPELIRKTLIVACTRSGLAHCEKTGMVYFPSGIVRSDRLYFKKPDGVKSFVNSVGRRTYWRPRTSSEYRYHLAPVFRVQHVVGHTYTVLTRIRIRLTDNNGTLLKSRTALSRRKHLCQDWWNDDWLHRILAVMEFLGDGQNIEIGDLPDDTLIVSGQPEKWTVPIGIDEEALLTAVASRKEALKISLDIDDVDDNYSNGSDKDE